MTISIACPMYNEEASAPEFIKRVTQVLSSINEPFELVLVNDGSTDSTLQVLHALASASLPRIRVIDLSRNFGKEAALSAAVRVIDSATLFL